MAQESLLQRQQRLQSQFPERLVAVADGAQLAWREAGNVDSDFAVVLLHGISSGAASWQDVAAALGDQVRVLAWDAPGYGASSALPQPSPRDLDYAQRLDQALQVLGVRRCILLGHSLGALVAAKFAAMAGAQRVEQLVLISPAGGYGAASKAQQRAKVRSTRLASLAEKGVAGLAAVIDQRLVAAHAGESVREWVRWNTSRMQASGYAQAVELLCESDLAQAAGHLGMPVQVWVGSEDVVTPVENCRDWAGLLGAAFATLEAAGHASPIEIAPVIANRLRSMLP